jgi:hypothetical protein
VASRPPGPRTAAELQGDHLGNVVHWHVGAERPRAVGDHRHAEWARDSERIGAGREQLLGALDVDALTDAFFHPHAAAAGSTAQASAPGSLGLRDRDDGQRALERLAWRVVDIVVAAEVTAVVVRDHELLTAIAA